jgi:hypothetical protein
MVMQRTDPRPSVIDTSLGSNEKAHPNRRTRRNRVPCGSTGASGFALCSRRLHGRHVRSWLHHGHEPDEFRMRHDSPGFRRFVCGKLLPSRSAPNCGSTRHSRQVKTRRPNFLRCPPPVLRRFNSSHRSAASRPCFSAPCSIHPLPGIPDLNLSQRSSQTMQPTVFHDLRPVCEQHFQR